jgi:hypothetical protein
MANYPNLPRANGAIPVALAGNSSITQTTVAVPANTDTVLVAANANRSFLLFTILTTGQTAYVAFDQAAVLTQGMPFGSTGSPLGSSYGWGSNPPSNALHIICASAITVIVWEGSFNP